jgi:hypothetical protein
MPTHTGKSTHTAVVARLLADSTLSALVSTRVYGPRAPQGATFPYVTLQVVSTPFDTKTRTGHEHFLRVQGYADTNAGSLAQAADMRAAVYASLHQASFAVSGGAVIECIQNGLDDVGMEPDNERAQFTTEFRCLVQQTS